MTAVLAFDLGATSARGIVYRLENGYLEEAEVFRFDQYQYYLSSSKEYHWDMRKIKETSKIIAKLTINIKSKVSALIHGDVILD